jgi:hypothetical protein
MTHEVAPALFVIHEAAAVREAIQGGQYALSGVAGNRIHRPRKKTGAMEASAAPACRART